MSKIVYVDNGATTKPDSDVISKMVTCYSENYGNPSSIHSMGLDSQKAIESVRLDIAKTLNASKDEIFFTSGSTESINMVVLSYARENKSKGNHLITTNVEHKAVLNTFKQLEKEGFKVDILGVDEEGFIDIEDFKNKLTDDTLLVSIGHANNEIGTIQDLKTIGNICFEKNIFFHSDTTQSYTKVPIDVEELKLSSCCISAHKFHGPKGIGAVYIKKKYKLKPHILGGGQEKNQRSGTQNVPAIVGMGVAATEGIRNMDAHVKHMNELKEYLLNKILTIPNTYLNGPTKDNFDKRLCNNVNVSFDFIEGEAMLLYLDIEGVKCSTGSACSSNTLRPSHVLDALGVPFERMHGTLRFTVSKNNTFEECDYVFEKLKEVVERLRAMSPLTKD